MKRGKKVVVIVIPTYDEKGNIGRAIEKLEEVFKKVSSDAYDPHILVVDDSSPDGTAVEVRDFMRKFKNVHLLVNKRKMGLGGAYLSGMKYATETLDPDIYFEFDADLSHDPLLIPKFLEKIHEGYDLVLGSRYIPGGAIPENWGLKRKFYSVVGNMIIMTVLSDFRVRDWTTGYRALTRDVYEKVHPLLGEERFFGYTFQIGFLHKAVRLGFKIGEVPLKFVDRTLGRSKLGAEYIKNTLIYIFKERFLELSRFFKFLAVGGFGTVLQFSTWLMGYAWLGILQPDTATVVGGQIAIVSNFILNNVWTFREARITTGRKLARSFLKFFLTSNIAVIGIQKPVTWFGKQYFGASATTPNLIFFVIALAFTLIWNYTIYNRFIWKVKK